MVRVKICGITNAKDAEQAVLLGAWALGFNFYKKSKRYITPVKARSIIKKMPSRAIPIGVFVNADKKTIEKTVRICGLKAVQLHGNESPQFCRALKGIKIIKAFRVDKNFDFSIIKKYSKGMLLFDAKVKNTYGGSGKSFNWKLVPRHVLGRRHFILSGGLNPKNIRKAIKRTHPFAVDVASGVERSPGKKDMRLLQSLFDAVSS